MLPERKEIPTGGTPLLEVSEEFLLGGMVPAIAAPGHGGRDVILLSEDKIRLRSVLQPLVTVEDESIGDLFCLALRRFCGTRVMGFSHPNRGATIKLSYRSLMVDRSAWPSRVKISVTALTHFWLGRVAAKARLSRLGWA